MSPRGWPVKLETEKERLEAKRVNNARRQRQHKEHQRAKRESEANEEQRACKAEHEDARPGLSDSSNSASGPQVAAYDKDEPHLSVADDTADRVCMGEYYTCESGMNILYWAAVLIRRPRFRG
jgi:hypothetical protein